MSVFPQKRDTEREIQNTAELIFKWMKGLHTPRDGVAALMLAHTAALWTQQPADEAMVRKMLEQYTDGVVALYQAQVAAAQPRKLDASSQEDRGIALARCLPGKPE